MRRIYDRDGDVKISLITQEEVQRLSVLVGTFYEGAYIDHRDDIWCRGQIGPVVVCWNPERDLIVFESNGAECSVNIADGTDYEYVDPTAIEDVRNLFVLMLTEGRWQ